MGWYDVFSTFYDASLKGLYDKEFDEALKALELKEGMSVLDCPCGTGAMFSRICTAIGDRGVLIGLDASKGMLKRAQKKVNNLDGANVQLLHKSVLELRPEHIIEAGCETGTVDRVLIFLGLTAFPEWTTAFDQVWNILRPGGKMVVVDVHAEELSFQGKMVNITARADITRKVWEPLEAKAEDYDFQQYLSHKKHGGEIVIAHGFKPMPKR